MSTKRQALGKGLSALLQNAETDITTKKDIATDKVVGAVSSIPVSYIEANPFQPRTHFEEESLKELSESIREHGIIQPITVRKLGYDKFQLISGERRFRASQMAGLKEIPAYIRVANDQSMLEMALVENIQREELDAIEIALSYKRLMEECKLSQEELGFKVSKQRSTITNYLRLLKLPPPIQLGIRNRKISMGHARALITVDDADVQLAIYEQIEKNDLSVRNVEELARGKKTAVSPSGKKRSLPVSFQQQKLKEDLSAFFQTSVEVKRQNNGEGRIVIPFHNDKELKQILDAINL
jgi:ParB family chromosome partitioning protein